MKLVKPDLKTTKQQKLNLVFGDILSANAKDSGNMGFISKHFVQSTLPHSDPGEVPIWGRQNGNIAFAIQPGFAPSQDDDQPKLLGLPYGSIPRLLVIWLTTEIVHKKTRNIILGPTLSSFMHQIGLIPSGGRWGTISRLKDQMQRLFSARIGSCILDEQEDITNFKFDSVNIAKTQLWWNPKEPDQTTLWESEIELSQEFFEMIKDTSFPIDMRIINVIKNSSFELDLYCWLTHRTFRLREKTTFIPWKPLSEQFGANYDCLRDFKKAFLSKIKNILIVSPDIKILESKDGLYLENKKKYNTKIPKNITR